jgi:hypothetical protein
VYERIKRLLSEEDWSQGAYQAAMEVFARDGWDDPRMDVYDELDPRRTSLTSNAARWYLWTSLTPVAQEVKSGRR